MDAQEAIRRLRERTEYDVTLPSGLPAIVREPDRNECIMAGGIPLPVVARMEEIAGAVKKATADAEGNGTAVKIPEVSPEEMQFIRRFRQETARQTLVGLDGERIEDEVTLELIQSLHPRDFDALVATGFREKESLIPKASAVTS